VTFGVLNLFGNQILCGRCAAVQFGRSDARYCSYSHIILQIFACPLVGLLQFLPVK